MNRYVLYHSEAEMSYSFFVEGDQSNMKLLPEDAKLIWTTEAKSWDEACIKQHQYLGWEPYKPMDN